mgnify:CR=1 FL=1
MPKFRLGELLMTRGINDLASRDEEFARFTYESLKRHRQGDWGDLAEKDKKENDFSLIRICGYCRPIKEEITKSG